MDTSGDDFVSDNEELEKDTSIKQVQLGKYEIEAWYFSPLPEEYQKEAKIWFCEYCLRWTKLEKMFKYHMSKCTRRQPPGLEVYNQGSLSIWEVNSSDHKTYCQSLCLLAKFFIDHKPVEFAVEPYLFYVLCEVDEMGAHLVGYFSKEKNPPDCHNVACIMIMPPFQNQGYGTLLIAFSYELSKLEGLVVSPQKPLSLLGEYAYKSYWSRVLLDILKNGYGTYSILDLSKITSISMTDISSTLESMDMVKYWKGQHVICVTPKHIEQLVNSEQYKSPRFILDKNAIKWTPKKYDSQQGPSRAAVPNLRSRPKLGSRRIL